MGCLESTPEQSNRRSHGHNPKPHVDYSDFTKYYKYIRRQLKTRDFKFGYTPDLVSFKKVLAASSGIHKQVAKTWIVMYVDYMIFSAWRMYFAKNFNANGENNANNNRFLVIYPPYAIQQVVRLHVIDIQNFASFCLLITDGQGMVPYAPLKLMAQQKSYQETYNLVRDAYNTTRDFLKQNLYENPSLHKTFQRQTQAETLWEDFDMTLMQCEFCFYFIGPNSKEKFQKTVAENADELTMTSRDPDEIVRVGKGVRRALGIGDLMSAEEHSQQIYNPIIKPLNNGPENEPKAVAYLSETNFSVEFVNILAWEQRISVEEAKRWIDEYMKVLYMIVSSEGKIVGYASEAVNQVWHLHKRYVHEYHNLWQKIDPNHKLLFKIDIERTHTPYELYENTLSSYEKIFGQPNKDIWPDPNTRFEEAGNLASYYLFFARNCITEEQKAKLFKKYLEQTEKKNKDKNDQQGEEYKNDTYYYDSYPGSDFGSLILGMMLMGGAMNFASAFATDPYDANLEESQDQLLDDQSVANYTIDEGNNGLLFGLAANEGLNADDWARGGEDNNGGDGYGDDGGDDDGGDGGD